MKAMIFAAGLGTRLRPITNNKPKALVEVNGVPLLETVLNCLIAAGVSEVIINLHHFSDQIKDFLRQKDNFGIRIEFSGEETLLDTGGGLKKAAWFFDDGHSFLVHNVDILSNIDLRRMVEFHLDNHCMATLAVNQREGKRYLVFDEDNLLCGWKSLRANKEVINRTLVGEPKNLGFCGIHVISPEFLDRMNETGAFSIITSYVRLAGEGERILAFRADEYSWRDVGKLEELNSPGEDKYLGRL